MADSMGNSIGTPELEPGYELAWTGKQEALAQASSPTDKALVAVPEQSLEPSDSGNIFIEGDNLEALKLLATDYASKIKVIYIDPPYNTGTDRIYHDNFVAQQTLTSGLGTDTTRYFPSADTHSHWLNHIYPRLAAARPLLRDDGVIFISISDHEFHNLRFVCDEIFGADNHIATIMWHSTKSVTNTALVSVGHTYNLAYAKNKQHFIANRTHFRMEEDGTGFKNPDHDPRGPWKADNFQAGGWRPNQQYAITNPNTGTEYTPNEGNSWKNDHERFQELLADGRITFGLDGRSGPMRKRFLSEAKQRGKVISTWWDDVGSTSNGTQHVKKLFGGKQVFTNPKPVDLIERFIQLGDHSGSGIVLDFYAGSGTTGEAVMSLNAKHNASRKFILVQLPEPVDADSKDYPEAVAYLSDNDLPLNLAAVTRARLKLAAASLSGTLFEVNGGFKAFHVG